ncbi:hypothetical protein ACQKP0_08945 [Heyndrickxia sp. NPDC080065]|uniref:hypothetical protein n=1 Tax=Heyndrickxia sp. NPDC080065 TaxID=3390568 RepID=UPI003D06F6F5
MKENKAGSKKHEEKLMNGLYGIDPEMSLLSVNFASKENSYLNENVHEDCREE